MKGYKFMIKFGKVFGILAITIAIIPVFFLGEAKANQVGFNKKINLQCTYTTNQGINTEIYQFDGKNVSWQGMGVELGVPYDGGDFGLSVKREGNSSIIKTKLDSSGMTLNYTIDIQSLQAEYVLEGLNIKVLGTCISL